MSLIDKKITARLSNDVGTGNVDELIENALSPYRFDSADQLTSYLIEGASIRVGQIAAEALSIRPGHFLIWDADDDTVVLYDIEEEKQSRVHTSALAEQYQALRMVVNEEDGQDVEPEFNLTIDRDTVDRTALLAGMERSGHTVTSLAKAVGVDPPAISRILRKPKKGRTDPGGRNPSLGLAAQVCDELKVPVTKAFSDIFGRKSEYKPKQVKGNSQSGQNKGLKKELGE